MKARTSLLERAAEVYDFNAAIRGPWAAPFPAEDEPVRVREAGERPKKRKQPLVLSAPEPETGLVLSDSPVPFAEPTPFSSPVDYTPEEPLELTLDPAPDDSSERIVTPSRFGTVNHKGLLDAGYIVPDAPVSTLAEEFRIIKRQLLLKVSGGSEVAADKRQTVLVCSAQPDEGKTFCALNLALSLAAERDVEVLLVDGDFAKPEILTILGIDDGPGLIDAVAEPDADVNSFVVATDIPGLSVLPAGRQANNVTELLASSRTRQVLSDLTRRHPRRIVIFDSPPALMASAASVLASQVGQVLLIVRADETTEANLKEAVALLSACDHLSLMLNGAGVAATSRRFGSYGYGQ
jgi:exopolysaccharide/PEP-CTERM locus tyrosine autokinase